MELTIDTEQFAQDIKAGRSLTGKDGALRELVKQVTELALQAEIETHLAQDLSKTVKMATPKRQ